LFNSSLSKSKEDAKMILEYTSAILKLPDTKPFNVVPLEIKNGFNCFN